MKYSFVKWMELNEGYFFDVVKPLIEKYLPDLEYSAWLIGYGSDVLWLDTPVSMDHNWGPRLMIFLSEDSFEENFHKLDVSLREHLPVSYRGFPTNFTDKRKDVTQSMLPVETGPVNHLIWITTVSAFVKRSIWWDMKTSLNPSDWLAFSEQGLIELTKWKMFHDGLGTVEIMRKELEFFPDDVFRAKLASLWRDISNEEAFLGRTIELKDQIGLRLLASRIVNTTMKICFYLERQYIPYSKWFGSMFNELRCSKDLSPIILEILTTSEEEKIDGLMAELVLKIVEIQNALCISEIVELAISDYYGRPYKVVYTDKIVDALRNAIASEELRKINFDSIGIEQKISAIDFTNSLDFLKKIVS